MPLVSADAIGTDHLIPGAAVADVGDQPLAGAPDRPHRRRVPLSIPEHVNRAAYTVSRILAEEGRRAGRNRGGNVHLGVRGLVVEVDAESHQGRRECDAIGMEHAQHSFSRKAIQPSRDLLQDVVSLTTESASTNACSSATGTTLGGRGRNGRRRAFCCSLSLLKGQGRSAALEEPVVTAEITDETEMG